MPALLRKMPAAEPAMPGADDDGFAGSLRHVLLLMSQGCYESTSANYLII
jgi:hypothetical protein